MLYVVFSVKDDPVMTIGDAIESFSMNPDPNTRGMCLLSINDVRSKDFKGLADQPPRPYASSPRRWHQAASQRRWTLFIILFSGALLSVVGLFGFAVYSLPARSRSNLWGLGFGTVTPQTLITGWTLTAMANADTAIVSATLIANLPQVVLSFLYITLNGIVTSMFVAREWSSYGTQTKGLRVSRPTHPQRRTYFLALPYRIAVPLIAMSTLVHWLIAQSIFLAVVGTYNASGVQTDATAVVTCGFSPIAMIFCFVVGVVLIGAVAGMGLFKLQGGMPLAGSCSLAISAACHGDRVGNNSPRLLRWGEMEENASDRGVGHCAFSSGSVSAPVTGRLYA